MTARNVAVFRVLGLTVDARPCPCLWSLSCRIFHIFFVSVDPALFEHEIWRISTSPWYMQPLARCLCQPKSSGNLDFYGRRLHELFLYSRHVHASDFGGLPDVYTFFLRESGPRTVRSRPVRGAEEYKKLCTSREMASGTFPVFSRLPG